MYNQTRDEEVKLLKKMWLEESVICPKCGKDQLVHLHILIGLAFPVLIVCFIFVGGIALLVPVVMIAIAAGILKACL